MNIHHRLSFGCHVTDSNMEPEFFVREMNSGGEVSTHLGSCHLLLFVSCGDGAGGFWLVVVCVCLWAVIFVCGWWSLFFGRSWVGVWMLFVASLGEQKKI